MLLCKDQEPLAVLQGFAVKKCLDEQRICHSLMLDLENHSVAPSNATRFFMSLMHPDPAERQGLEMKDSPYLAEILTNFPFFASPSTAHADAAGQAR